MRQALRGIHLPHCSPSGLIQPSADPHTAPMAFHSTEHGGSSSADWYFHLLTFSGWKLFCSYRNIILSHTTATSFYYEDPSQQHRSRFSFTMRDWMDPQVSSRFVYNRHNILSVIFITHLLFCAVHYLLSFSSSCWNGIMKLLFSTISVLLMTCEKMFD